MHDSGVTHILFIFPPKIGLVCGLCVFICVFAGMCGCMFVCIPPCPCILSLFYLAVVSPWRCLPVCFALCWAELRWGLRPFSLTRSRNMIHILWGAFPLGFLAKPGQSWLRIYGERGMPGGTDWLETAWPSQHHTIWRTQVVPIKCVYQMAPYSHVVPNFWPGPIGYRVPFGTKLYCFWPSLHQAFLSGSAISLGSQYDTNNCGLETLRLPDHPNSLSLFHFISMFVLLLCLSSYLASQILFSWRWVLK